MDIPDRNAIRRMQMVCDRGAQISVARVRAIWGVILQWWAAWQSLELSAEEPLGIPCCVQFVVFGLCFALAHRGVAWHFHSHRQVDFERWALPRPFLDKVVGAVCSRCDSSGTQRGCFSGGGAVSALHRLR